MYEDQSASVAVEPAGFGVRLLAWLLDALVLMSLGIALNLTLGGLPGAAIAIGLGVVYTVGLWWATGSTLGKAVMGLKVISADGYETIDGATAVLRYVGYIVSAIPLYLGFLWVAVDGSKQGWHDKIARTLVVHMR
ncbi:MAG TPA: RDD family protein [Dehalococcoidia bacterium]|nr:RDD family protein [Dehalococcoidia bacterium]